MGQVEVASGEGVEEGGRWHGEVNTRGGGGRREEEEGRERREMGEEACENGEGGFTEEEGEAQLQVPLHVGMLVIMPCSSCYLSLRNNYSPFKKMFNNSSTESSSLLYAVAGPNHRLKNRTIFKSAQLGFFTPECTKRRSL